MKLDIFLSRLEEKLLNVLPLHFLMILYIYNNYYNLAGPILGVLSLLVVLASASWGCGRINFTVSNSPLCRPPSPLKPQFLFQAMFTHNHRTWKEASNCRLYNISEKRTKDRTLWYTCENAGRWSGM